MKINPKPHHCLEMMRFWICMGKYFFDKIIICVLLTKPEKMIENI